ncbi:hypothetical protein DL767_008003 [Monosporascus sp. MG133]|nr:hypothetical protein DL767_008003 [Monosporascus sp. MG133]
MAKSTIRYRTWDSDSHPENGPIYRTVLRTPLRDADSCEIPPIDIAGAFSESLSDPQAVARQVRDAAANNGFFYIKNYGTPSEVMRGACKPCLNFFRQPHEMYWRSCLAVAQSLVKIVALSLDLPEGFFAYKFGYPDAALALNYYPPIEAPKCPTDPTLQVSIGSHTDFQLFTMLWQDANGGLHVLDRQGQCINAKPIPGTFVVNIADYMQRITNDCRGPDPHIMSSATSPDVGRDNSGSPKAQPSGRNAKDLNFYDAASSRCLMHAAATTASGA